MNTPEHISADVPFANAVAMAASRALPSTLPLLKEERRCLMRRNRQSGVCMKKGTRP